MEPKLTFKFLASYHGTCISKAYIHASKHERESNNRFTSKPFKHFLASGRLQGSQPYANRTRTISVVRSICQLHSLVQEVHKPFALTVARSGMLQKTTLCDWPNQLNPVPRFLWEHRLKIGLRMKPSQSRIDWLILSLSSRAYVWPDAVRNCYLNCWPLYGVFTDDYSRLLVARYKMVGSLPEWFRTAPSSIL